MVLFMYPPDLGGGTGKNTPPAGSASPFGLRRAKVMFLPVPPPPLCTLTNKSTVIKYGTYDKRKRTGTLLKTTLPCPRRGQIKAVEALGGCPSCTGRIIGRNEPLLYLRVSIVYKGQSMHRFLRRSCIF